MSDRRPTERETMKQPKLRCPKCGAYNAYGGDAETYPCSRCGFDGRSGHG